MLQVHKFTLLDFGNMIYVEKKKCSVLQLCLPTYITVLVSAPGRPVAQLVEAPRYKPGSIPDGVVGIFP